MGAGVKQYRMWLYAVLAGVALTFASTTVYAQSPKAKAIAAPKVLPEILPETFLFMGSKVKRHQRIYVVTKDVNIRAKPLTKSKRLGQLKTRQIINVVGRAPGKWVAVRDGDKDIGFVYAPVLLAIINGKLDAQIVGRVHKPGYPQCLYSIRYEGKSEAEGQLFEIADYEVDWTCRDGKISREFSTPMFMAEGANSRSKALLHQITIDIVDIYGDLGEVVSTTVFYNPENATVSFDGISVKRFSGKPQVLEVLAENIQDALRATVKMAYEAWRQPIWKVLMKESQ